MGWSDYGFDSNFDGLILRPSMLPTMGLVSAARDCKRCGPNEYLGTRVENYYHLGLDMKFPLGQYDVILPSGQQITIMTPNDRLVAWMVAFDYTLQQYTPPMSQSAGGLIRSWLPPSQIDYTREYWTEYTWQGAIADVVNKYGLPWYPTSSISTASELSYDTTTMDDFWLQPTKKINWLINRKHFLDQFYYRRYEYGSGINGSMIGDPLTVNQYDSLTGTAYPLFIVRQVEENNLYQVRELPQWSQGVGNDYARASWVENWDLSHANWKRSCFYLKYNRMFPGSDVILNLLIDPWQRSGSSFTWNNPFPLKFDEGWNRFIVPEDGVLLDESPQDALNFTGGGSAIQRIDVVEDLRPCLLFKEDNPT